VKLFDTHCHFETADSSAVSPLLERARAAGVAALTAVGGSPALNDGARAAYALSRADASLPRVYLALGWDRDQLGGALPPIPDADLACWGEIGLDYHYSPETRDAQRAHFAAQLEEARRRGLPVSIHTREADDDTLALLREIPSRGVIHCFTGTPDFARKLLDLGFYISISGIVTFRLADNVRASADVVPDDRLLIETDAPYLAPVPMRGRPNEPAFVAHTCAFLAARRGKTPEALAETTYLNAERLFASARV